MRPLDRKLLRDLSRSRGQIFSIAAVVACGVASVIAMRSTLDTMQRASEGYYREARFPHVFATLQRAPERIALRISEIDGVAAIETRIAGKAVLHVPGLREAATGYFVSIPESGEPLLSKLYLRRGRFAAPGSTDEVLINEHFAEANGLSPGDSIQAVLNGRWRELVITGVALSPEYVHDAIPASGLGMFGDSRHTGVLWMRRDALGPVYDMDGAFNDVVLLLTSRASQDHVIAEVDRLLKPYGGGHAYPRKDQLSANIVAGELEQLRVFGTAMPVIFLTVAVFLLNIVLSRLVTTQREQIATLKAFGYSNGAIAVHFLGYPVVAVAAGSVMGIALGVWAGSAYTDVYVKFFRFPVFEHYVSPMLVVTAVAVSAVAAMMGALAGVRAAVSLPPAEGMRPPAPAVFRKLLADRLGIGSVFSPAIRMIMRNVERRPIRTATSVFGVALAAAILVVGTFAFDTANYLGDLQFTVVQREDVSVSFAKPRPVRAVHEIEHLEGVSRVEGYRMTPVRISSGHRSRQIPVTGLTQGSKLRRLADSDGNTYAMPSTGIVLTTALARILDVQRGDTVKVEVLEKGDRERQVVVAGLVDELIGMAGYMEIGELNRVVGEGRVINGVNITVDPEGQPRLLDELGALPGVSGSATRRAMVQSFDEQIADALRLTVLIVVSLACVVALGVVYNGIRIALSERSRDLASLRVLGFTRREVASLLYGEQALINLAGTPLGLVLGLGLAYWIATGFKSELYRFPVVILPHTYLFSAGVIVVAAIAAGWMMRRRIYDLNLVAVLKTTE